MSCKVKDTYSGVEKLIGHCIIPKLFPVDNICLATMKLNKRKISFIVRERKKGMSTYQIRKQMARSNQVKPKVNLLIF